MEDVVERMLEVVCAVEELVDVDGIVDETALDAVGDV